MKILGLRKIKEKNYTIYKNDWLEFCTLEFNYHTAIDKLKGWADALEATKEYINIHGSLKINPKSEEDMI